MSRTETFILPPGHDCGPDHPEARELFYGRIIIPAAKLWMRLVQRVQVVILHPERSPLDGGALLAVNHTGYWDFVYGGIPAHFHGRRLVRFMAKKEIWDAPVAGPVMTGMHQIPVDRADGQASMDEAVRRLRAGQLVGIFPEATISRSFEVKELRQGAARIAREAGAPLIPVAIWGSQRIWTKGRKPVWRPDGVNLVMAVGEPVEVDDDAAATTDRLRAAMQALVEDARAEYVRRYGPMPAGEFWVPAALGGSAPTLDEATVKDREDQQRRKEQRAAREQAKADRDRRNREELAAAPGPLRPVVRLRQRWRDRRRS